MNDFPDFMRKEANRIPLQPGDDRNVAGYFYRGDGGGQMAFWTCHFSHTSKKHTHDFDEYLVCAAGTRTIHAFGGERIK